MPTAQELILKARIVREKLIEMERLNILSQLGEEEYGYDVRVQENRCQKNGREGFILIWNKDISIPFIVRRGFNNMIIPMNGRKLEVISPDRVTSEFYRLLKEFESDLNKLLLAARDKL